MMQQTQRPRVGLAVHCLSANMLCMYTFPMQMCCAGTGAEFMAIDEETKKQTRESLAVKVKPKRGKSSRKQKQRLAIKFDKVLLHPQI
jgi:hypothetical protein